MAEVGLAKGYRCQNSIPMQQDGQNIKERTILRLIERQGYRCALSGRELTPEAASIDHRIPISRGGAHDLGNVQIVHHQVNSAKGTMTAEEFIALCRDVVKHHRRAQPASQSQALPLFPEGK